MTTTTSPPAARAEQAAEKRTARALLARREDPWQRAVRFVVLLLGLAVFAAAWQVTGIDLKKLTNAANARPILTALVTPDVVSRELSTIELQAPLQVGQSLDQPVEATNSTGQKLRITPGGIDAGQTIVFEGSGFEPNGTGQIRLVLPDGRDLLFPKRAASHGEQCGLGAAFAMYLRGAHEESAYMAEVLRRHGLPVLPEEIGFTVDEFVRVVKFAPETRPGRYTILEHLDLTTDQIKDIYADYVKAIGS